MARRERFTFTTEILDRAERLKQKRSWRWVDVAHYLECDCNVLEATLCNRRSGKWQGNNDVWQAERKAIADKILKGARPSALARELGVSRAAISKRLKRMGLDREVRAELGREIKTA